MKNRNEITPGDVLHAKAEFDRAKARLESLVAEYVDQNAEHRQGERVDGGTNADGVPSYKFRVKKIEARIAPYGRPNVIEVTYSGPRFKQDGGEHASASGYAFEFINLVDES